MRKGILFVLLTMLVSTAFADVLFYDNFERADGDVGNNWQFNTPPHLTNSSIINGVFNMELTSTGNSYHTFTSQTSGKVYVEYDWKLITNDWTACIYPVGESIYIRYDWEGNLSYDDNSNFTSPTFITQINFEQWYDLKICYDLDNSTFSFWLDNIQLITDVTANTINSINSFYFLNLNAQNVVQQIDEFIVYNDTAPAIPQNLTATENVENISLNWEAVPEPLFVNYKIFRDIMSNPTTEIAEVGPEITTYVDAIRASQNTDYYYRIKAVGLDGQESDYSNEIGPIQLKPDISFDSTEFEIKLNVENTTSTDFFEINNSGNGELEYVISGKDTLNSENEIPEISGFTVIGESGGHHYYLSTTQMTWHNAKQACEIENGHLVVITSQEENNFVQHPIEYCWIGFTDEEQEGIWRSVLGDTIWIGDANGQPYQGAFNNWDSNQPNDIGGSGNQDYAEIYPSGVWNDRSINYENYFILEIDNPPTQSILYFSPSSGTIEAGRLTQQVEMTTDGSGLIDGIYETASIIQSNAVSPNDSLEIPVTVIVDYNPPLAVQNVVFVETESSYDCIKLIWDYNAESDSVYYYNVYRKREGESNDEYVLKGTSETNEYEDYDFTGLDDCNFYYKVSAVDWVDNEGTKSNECLGYLLRFQSPVIISSEMINNNRDFEIMWNQVTQTMSGSPGTPTCYVIYFNESATPNEDFSFLSIATDTLFVHQNVGLFQEQDKMFYIVTAYGGSLRALNYFNENDVSFKLGKLDKMVSDFKNNKFNFQKTRKLRNDLK